MKKHTWKIDLASLLLIVSVACAHAAETPRFYEEAFSLGVAGWTSLSTASHVASGGAVDGGGYLKASRHNVFPGHHRITAEVGSNLNEYTSHSVMTNLRRTGFPAHAFRSGSPRHEMCPWMVSPTCVLEFCRLSSGIG